MEISIMDFFGFVFTATAVVSFLIWGGNRLTKHFKAKWLYRQMRSKFYMCEISSPIDSKIPRKFQYKGKTYSFKVEEERVDLPFSNDWLGTAILYINGIEAVAAVKYRRLFEDKYYAYWNEKVDEKLAKKIIRAYIKFYNKKFNNICDEKIREEKIDFSEKEVPEEEGTL